MIVSSPSASHPKFRDLLYVSLLVLYIFAGMMLAPFHGDEATIIYLSKDWYRIAIQHDLSTVLYRGKIDDPRLSDEQEFRLQNGVISKYAIGLAASLLGQPVEAINDPWFWGADYDDNLAHGHLPKPIVLLAGRFSSTLMLALSAVLIFRIGWQLAGCPAAWIGALVYTVLPAVLLDGRRAMFEGATLLAVALVFDRALALVRHRTWTNWLLLGLGCGFALASKHSLLIVIVPALGLAILLWWPALFRALRGALAASLLTVAIFLVLNPAWWNAPLIVPGEVLRLRQGVLNAQVDIYGGYHNLSDRVMALVDAPLGSAQYYEDTRDWRPWIGGQITAYEASGLGGFDANRIGWVVYPLIVLGIVALLAARRPAGLLFVGILVAAVLALLVATPLPWQRYYLLLAAPWTTAAGVGAAVILRGIMSYRRRTIPAPPQPPVEVHRL